MKVLKIILSAAILLNLLNGCTGQINQTIIPVDVQVNNSSLNSQNLIVKIKTGSEEQFLNLVKSLDGIESHKVLSKKLNLTEIKINGNKKLISNSLKNSLLTEYIDEDIFFNINSGLVQNNESGGFNVKANQKKNNWPLTQINAPKSSENNLTNEVKVAVIDTGIDSSHPAFRGNLLPMIDILGEEGWDDIYKENGISADYSGKDGNGHGTHVSGIINSVINYSGGNKIKILPIKAFNHEGRTSTGILTKAVLKAVERGADVINLSIGGQETEENKSFKDAIELANNRGIIVISSVGNDSRRSTGKRNAVNVPAAYPDVISVGAINREGSVSDFSNSGPEIDIVAPGGENIANDDSVKVTSAWPGYPTFEEYKNGIKGPEASMAGTSMSCPFVSAAAALILSKDKNLKPVQVRLKLLSTADDIYSPGFDNSSGYGKLNLSKALQEEALH